MHKNYLQKSITRIQNLKVKVQKRLLFMGPPNVTPSTAIKFELVANRDNKIVSLASFLLNY